MRLTLLAATLLLVAGCDAADSSGATRTFDVTFRDTSGADVSQATLTFERPAAGGVTMGTYHHVSGRRLATTDPLRATGQEDGRVRITLDLGVADGGVELVGSFSGSASDGTWSVGSFGGPVPGGTFTAKPA